MKLFERRYQMELNFVQCSQMNRGWDHVVARLATVNVIIWMNAYGLDGARPSSTEQFGRAMSDHLVGVHVRGRAGAGLENVHQELAVERAVGHLLCGTLNCIRKFCIEQAERL